MCPAAAGGHVALLHGGGGGGSGASASVAVAAAASAPELSPLVLRPVDRNQLDGYIRKAQDQERKARTVRARCCC